MQNPQSRLCLSNHPNSRLGGCYPGACLPLDFTNNHNDNRQNHEKHEKGDSDPEHGLLPIQFDAGIHPGQVYPYIERVASFYCLIG